MTKAWSVIGSTALLIGVALLLFPWPKLPTWAKSEGPLRRIELPCKPPLSLLYWWNLDRVAAESTHGFKDQTASQNVGYYHQDDLIALRSELGGTPARFGSPWVSWRVSFTPGEVQIYYGTDDNVTTEQLEQWQQWVRDCEAPNRVVFAPQSLIQPAE